MASEINRHETETPLDPTLFLIIKRINRDAHKKSPTGPIVDETSNRKTPFRKT